MPFIKVQKTKAYFKRFQVKYRRRREGKTDYAARRALVIPEKNKYGLPKYRLVVRLTNRYVIAQVVYAEIDGDKVMSAANSAELARYGVSVGFKNYTAAYLTGYLCARRVLAKLGMAESYKGVEEPTGEVTKVQEGKRTHWVAELADDRKPFRCYLDVGLRRTTTGARVFSVMKGAVDGGLDIPHNERRFPGYIKEAKKYDPDELRNRITGGHIKDYMEYLAEEDVEMYEKRFAGYLSKDLDADTIEAMYSKAMDAIRADPSPAPKKAFTVDKSFKRPAKKSLDERKKAVAAKKEARAAKLAAALAEMGDGEGGDDEEEEEEDDE